MPDRSTRRLLVLRVVVLAMLATLVGRLAQLQLLSGDEYAQAATGNRVREVVTPAVRGDVLDVTGVPLLRDRPALVVTVERSRLRAEPDGGAAVLERLAPLVGRSADALRQAVTPCGGGVVAPCWRGSPYQPVPVAEVAADDAEGLQRVLAVEERAEDFPGVAVVPRGVREHALPDPTTAAHVLGHVGPATPEDGVRVDSLVGRGGVEASYDAALRGTDGVERLEVDHLGAVTSRAPAVEPVPGSTLVLSLHAGVQAVAEAALREALAAARTQPARGGGGALLRADSGAVVVLDARTGRVVALASAPSYDPSVFVGGLSTEQYAELVDEARGAPLLSR
ncbi:MAG TPA: hypothetical protein VNU66_09600, partial [Mycobacteriales bacterium]|nr:hypothetical protein [Mycobacteriales bacterium]